MDTILFGNLFRKMCGFLRFGVLSSLHGYLYLHGVSFMISYLLMSSYKNWVSQWCQFASFVHLAMLRILLTYLSLALFLNMFSSGWPAVLGLGYRLMVLLVIYLPPLSTSVSLLNWRIFGLPVAFMLLWLYGKRLTSLDLRTEALHSCEFSPLSRLGFGLLLLTFRVIRMVRLTLSCWLGWGFNLFIKIKQCLG